MSLPDSLLDPASDPVKLGTLLLSDYRAHCADRRESPAHQAILLVPRFLTDVSLHAALLVRLMTHSPRWTSWLWRNILVAKHGIDISPDVSIGRGLMLPHPIGIVIGPMTIIGSDVTIFQNVSLGVRRSHALAEFDGRRLTPRIDDGVVLHPGSLVAGPITVGAGAIVGSNVFVSRDVAPDSVLRS